MAKRDLFSIWQKEVYMTTSRHRDAPVVKTRGRLLAEEDLVRESLGNVSLVSVAPSRRGRRRLYAITKPRAVGFLV